MKLLLDENLPRKMRLELLPHEAFTARWMRWQGIGNGRLLGLAKAGGFDALITNDRGLEYEQNLTTLPISIVVLMIRDNRIETIRPLYPALFATLDALSPRTLVRVELPKLGTS
jgi:hypothetical protein